MSGTSEYLRFGPASIRGYVHDQPTLIITPSTILLPTSVTHTLPANFYDDVEPADRIVLDADHSVHKETITATGDFEIKAATSGKDISLIGTQDASVTSINGDVIVGGGAAVRITAAAGNVNIGGTAIALSGITTGLTLTKTLGAPYGNQFITANPLSDTGIFHYTIEATPTSGLVENNAGALPFAATIDITKLGNIVFMHLEKADITKEYKCVTAGPVEFLNVVPVAMRPVHPVYQAVNVYDNSTTTTSVSNAAIFSDGTVVIYGRETTTAAPTTLDVHFTGGGVRGDITPFTAVWVTTAPVAYP